MLNLLKYCEGRVKVLYSLRVRDYTNKHHVICQLHFKLIFAEFKHSLSVIVIIVELFTLKNDSDVRVIASILLTRVQFWEQISYKNCS
jgi:hypothetical protein